MGNDYSLDKESFSPKTDLPGGIVYEKNGWYDTWNQYEMGDCPLLKKKWLVWCKNQEQDQKWQSEGIWEETERFLRTFDLTHDQKVRKLVNVTAFSLPSPLLKRWYDC